MKDIFLERASTLALNRVFGFEPEIGTSLIEQLGAASEVFALGEKGLDEIFSAHSKYRGRLQMQMLDEACKELQSLEARGVKFISKSESIYPQLLKECPDSPIGLYVKSSSSLEEVFGNDNVSVVGTRDISPYGSEWCERIVRAISLCDNSPTIVSGLALGVDIKAHLSALKCGIPTIAVLPTGIDEIYPYRHEAIAERIANTPGCALITDFPPHTAPIAVNFLRRNRIIAGLSRATILVESKKKGGGTMTARLSTSYGRELYCLPGRCDDEKSAGCNLLIREKLADIIDSEGSICEQLGLRGHSKAKCESISQRLKKLHNGKADDLWLKLELDIAEYVRRNRAVTIEEIARKLGKKYEEVASCVRMMEANGIISIDLLQRCCICINF